jgi:hypothetical protein
MIKSFPCLLFLLIISSGYCQDPKTCILSEKLQELDYTDPWSIVSLLDKRSEKISLIEILAFCETIAFDNNSPIEVKNWMAQAFTGVLAGTIPTSHDSDIHLGDYNAIIDYFIIDRYLSAKRDGTDERVWVVALYQRESETTKKFIEVLGIVPPKDWVPRKPGQI